jgi:ribosomal protein S18 acetylase RimI-like enzyme
VHVQSWQEAYRGQIPDSFLDGLTVDSRIRMWTRAFESDLHVLVATDNGRIVGISSFGGSRDDPEDPSAGEIYTMYVLMEFWGSGVGQSLMDQALSKLREIGVVEVVLWVLSTNDRPIAFYRRAGFRPDGEEKTIERPGFEMNEIRLGMEL